MKALTPRRALPALLLCAALLAAFCAGALTGCASADLGKPLLKLDGQEISENMVQLLMARVKAPAMTNTRASWFCTLPRSTWRVLFCLRRRG